MEIVFVGHRCCDHSPRSGYDQVCALFPEAGWLDGRALEAGSIEWHREPRGASAGRPVFHVFYGDCSGKGLPALLRQRYPEAAIVSSAHQPVSRLRSNHAALAALESSDAIITVSDVQARELSTLGLPASIHAIPHGVWTTVFRPAAPSHIPRTDVLIVGSFLRDWDGARRVITELARHGVRSIALGAGAREHLRGELPVDVRPRVTEEELAALYNRAAAVFLPFQEATASNALVEAMSAGCPVVCPRFSSLIDEYVGDGEDAFEPGRYEVAVARLLQYTRSAADRDARSQTLMMRAGQFDWARLEPRFAAVYEDVAERLVVSQGLS
jgi:glycosyltransferase involved in cell wall biosynthesis